MANITETPAGKIGIGVFVVIAVGLAIFMGVHTMNPAPEVADPQEVKQDAQKAVESIQKQNLPPALKAEMLSHYQGMAKGGGNGKGGPAGYQTSPPTSGQ
jgi:hypothetical protein